MSKDKLKKWNEAYTKFIQDQKEYNEKIKRGEARGFFRIDPRRRMQMELCMKDRTFDPLGIDNNGISGIFKLIETNNLTELYKYLVYGCPLTVKDENGLTPLELSLKLKNKEATKMIINYSELSECEQLDLVKKNESL